MPRADVPAVTPALLADWPLPQPDEDGGKHARGAVLVVGGATSTPGAAVLAGLAALRVGAGKLKIATVEPVATAVAVAVPEARVVGLPVGPGGSLGADCVDDVVGLAERSQAVLIGPGLLGREPTSDLLRALLPALPDVPVVVDAVALGALALAPELAEQLRGPLVVTPNSGEVEDLLGEDLPPVEGAAAVAERYGCVVAAHGAAAAPDGRVWSDESGGIGLGTSGSGDVLAGAVAGLLARGADPAQAAVVGQYLHGVAGERLAERVGRIGFLARELLDELPLALARLG